MLDGEFRQALFAEPEEALEGYQLAEEEVSALKAIDSETMESLAGTLDERISKMGLGNLFLADHSVAPPSEWAGPAIGPDNIPV